MNPYIATIVYCSFVGLLFWLLRDHGEKPSKALWVPTIWFFLSNSRPATLWLAIFGIGGRGPLTTTAEQYVDGSPVDRFFYILMVLAAIVILTIGNRRVERLLMKNLPLILFFTYCLISCIWSDYPFVTLKRWTKGIGDVLMVLIVLTDPRPLAALRRFLFRVGFVVIPISVLFIKYFPDLGREYNIWTWTPTFCGVTETKNGLGMICMIFGLASVWEFLVLYGDSTANNRKRRLYAHGILILIVARLFIQIDSLTSFSCFLLGTGLMLAMKISTTARKPAFVHLMALVMIAVPLAALFADTGGYLVQAMGRNATLTGRTQIWSVVLKVAGNPWVGTGYESFWLGKRLDKIWTDFIPGLQEAHNGYLEIYLNLGWIGVSLFALLLTAGYHTVVRQFHQDRHTGTIKLVYFLVGVIYSLSEAGFRMLDGIWIVLLLSMIAIPDPAPEELPVLDQNSLSENEAYTALSEVVTSRVHLRTPGASCS